MGRNPFWKRTAREAGTGRCLCLELVRQEVVLGALRESLRR